MQSLWPERYEEQGRELAVTDPGHSAIFKIPTPKMIDDSLAVQLQRIAQGFNWTENVENRVERKTQLGDYRFTANNSFYDLANPFCFQVLPVVGQYLNRMQGFVERINALTGGDPREGWRLRDQYFHVTYQMYHWKKNSKRVYVVDDRLYDLFKNTDLPDWDFGELNFPLQSFYIKFPENTFYFDVPVDEMSLAMGVSSPEPQMAEGCFVTISEPTGEMQSRDLCVMVTGRSTLGPWDDNLAFVGIGIGPHTKLSEISFSHAEGVFNIGSEQLNVEVPHIIISLLLYIESQHPDIVPVDPPKRYSFGEIASPKERQRRIERQEQELAGKSKLSYLLIGSRLKTMDEQKADYERHTGRKLEEGHKVRGFYKQQPYGPRRSLRKKIRVEPYWRGPDYAESMAIKAQKLPTGKKRK
jgi:hypothetical protein